MNQYFNNGFARAVFYHKKVYKILGDHFSPSLVSVCFVLFFPSKSASLAQKRDTHTLGEAPQTVMLI